MTIDRCYTDDELDEMIREYENDPKAQESDRLCDECTFACYLNDEKKQYFRALLDIENEFYKTLSANEREDFRKLHRHPNIAPFETVSGQREKTRDFFGFNANMSKIIFGLNVKVAPVKESENWCRFIVVMHGTTSDKPQGAELSEFYYVDAQIESGLLQRLKCERFKYDWLFEHSTLTESEMVNNLMHNGVPVRDSSIIAHYLYSQGWLLPSGVDAGGYYDGLSEDLESGRILPTMD